MSPATSRDGARDVLRWRSRPRVMSPATSSDGARDVLRYRPRPRETAPATSSDGARDVLRWRPQARAMSPATSDDSAREPGQCRLQLPMTARASPGDVARDLGAESGQDQAMSGRLSPEVAPAWLKGLGRVSRRPGSLPARLPDPWRGDWGDIGGHRGRDEARARPPSSIGWPAKQ